MKRRRKEEENLRAEDLEIKQLCFFESNLRGKREEKKGEKDYNILMISVTKEEKEKKRKKWLKIFKN